MEESPLDQIPQILALARNAFSTGRTIDLSFRKQQLKQLHLMLTKEAKTLSTALYKDLHKPEIEGLLPEVIMTQNEALEALENLDDWAKPHFPSVPLMNMGDNCQIRYQPFGVCLIIGAWNYPVQLILLPLVGVIAAGNCAILKPSELAPHTAAALAEIIPKYLDKDCFRVVNGGVPQTTALLDQRFDHILYTGSSPVGKIIMGAAAKNLTPVTLELGGKSPTIVDKQVNVANAARRIIWGKFYNAGQTCIAPDYVLCAKGLEESLIKEMKAAILEFYGSDPKNSKSFARIINKRHFDRVRKMIEESSDQVVAGGDMDGDQLYISPTIILQPQLTSTVMREEIFGPVLPIISVSDVGAAIAFINEREKPLALYMFSTNQSSIDKVLNYTSSGGVVINDVLMHATVSSLPFGGVGNSGMGAYHGKHSFELFSHKRSTMVKKMGLEFLNQIRYPPYNPSKSAQILKVVTKSPSVLSASLRKIILLVILAIFLVRNPQNRIARAIRVLLGFD